MRTNSVSVRVGFCVGAHYPVLGGMEYVNHFLVENLNKIPQVQVSVACSPLTDVPKNFYYPYSIYRANQFLRNISWKLSFQNFKKMVQKENINILHGSMINDGGNKAYKLKKKYGLPMVISSHGFDVQTVPEIGYGACLEMETKKRIQNIIKNADHIIALCKMNMDHIIRLGGDEKKITIIPNGAHIHAINRIPFINQRGKFGIKPNDFLLLTIGRNKPIKRMNLLFKALALLKKTQIKCVCVGPIENLKKLVKKYNVEEMVILTGTIPKLDIKKSPPYTDLINLYRCSDLYLSTSFVECFSNAALDALSCGTPIVVGKNHGIRDIIIEGETGFVMKKETPHELADLIMVLKEKKNLRNDNNAISKSVEHMTWENTALQIFNIYKKVLNI